MPLHERQALAPLVMFDLGEQPGELAEAPFGTNMAFRREVFQKYGGFRTDLGPRPGSEIRNEDTEFGTRLLAAGERLWYQPSAVVHHSVAENRLKKEYFLAWWLDKGRAEIRQCGAPPSSRYRCYGIPAHMLRRVAMSTLRWVLTIEARQRFAYKLKVWEKLGEISECYRQSLRQGKNVAAQPG